MAAAKGMAASLTVADIKIAGVPLTELVPVNASAPLSTTGLVRDVSAAVTDVILARTIGGASTLTMQLLDEIPRPILNSGLFENGLACSFDGLDFEMVQSAKQGDQLQLIFEDAVASNLRKQKGAKTWKSTSDLPGFFQYLVNEANAALPAGATPIKLVMQPGPVSFGTGSGATSSSTETSIMRGTTATPDEDSWTCMQRLSNSCGYRAFSMEGTFYSGSDDWLIASFPAGGTLVEGDGGVMDIDGTFDVGMPLGQLTATVISDQWTNHPGQGVGVEKLGPFNGQWLIYSQQRNFYNPQASVIIQKPMTVEQVRLGMPTLQYV